MIFDLNLNFLCKYCQYFLHISQDSKLFLKMPIASQYYFSEECIRFLGRVLKLEFVLSTGLRSQNKNSITQMHLAWWEEEKWVMRYEIKSSFSDRFTKQLLSMKKLELLLSILIYFYFWHFHDSMPNPKHRD